MDRRVQGSLRGTQKIHLEPSSAHSTKTRRSSSHLHGNNTRGRLFCSHERGSLNSVSNLLRKQHLQECRNKVFKGGEGRLHSPSRCARLRPYFQAHTIQVMTDILFGKYF